MALYLPLDEVAGPTIDADRAADFLELNAFVATDSSVTTAELAGTTSVGAAADYDDVDDEMQEGREDLIRETGTGSTRASLPWVRPIRSHSTRAVAC